MRFIKQYMHLYRRNAYVYMFLCNKNRYGTRINVTFNIFADVWNNLTNVNALPYNLFH